MKTTLASIVLAIFAILFGYANNETRAADPIKIDENVKRLDSHVWDIGLTGPLSAVGMLEDGSLQLLNRATLSPKQSLKTSRWSGEIKFDNNGGRAYSDVWTFSVKGTNETEKEGTAEQISGVQVRITPGYGLMQLQQITGVNKDGRAVAKEIARTSYDLEREGGNEETKKKPSIPPGKWYKFLLVDDGKTVKFYFEGDKQPTLEGEYDAKLVKGERLLFHNRERKGGVNQSTSLRNIVITEK